MKNKGRLEGKLEGEQLGRLEGEQLGRLEGRLEGKLEGERETAIAIARELIAQKVDIDVIAKSTKLSLDEINSLKIGLQMTKSAP